MQNQPVAPDPNVADLQAQNAAAAALHATVRRPNQKAGNGHIDDTNSPISRTTTPNMYANHMIYHGLDEHHLQQPLAGFGLAGGNGRASPMNGEGVPQTQEELLALNSGLKTRVDELEVINDLIQRRLQHYEVYGAGQPAGLEGGHEAEAQLRAQIDALTASDAQLRSQLDESHRRENNFKRRLDEMELELKEAKESLECHENGRAKRPRLEEPVNGDGDVPQEVDMEATQEAPVEAPIEAPMEAPLEALVEAPMEASVEPVEDLAEVPVVDVKPEAPMMEDLPQASA